MPKDKNVQPQNPAPAQRPDNSPAASQGAYFSGILDRANNNQTAGQMRPISEGFDFGSDDGISGSDLSEGQ